MHSHFIRQLCTITISSFLAHVHRLDLPLTPRRHTHAGSSSNSSGMIIAIVVVVIAVIVVGAVIAVVVKKSKSKSSNDGPYYSEKASSPRKPDGIANPMYGHEENAEGGYMDVKGMSE